MSADLNYNDLSVAVQRVHWKIDKVEENLIKVEESLIKEVTDRQSMNQVIFKKFDKINSMIIYQLGAAILTLVIVIAMFMIK